MIKYLLLQPRWKQLDLTATSSLISGGFSKEVPVSLDTIFPICNDFDGAEKDGALFEKITTKDQ